MQGLESFRRVVRRATKAVYWMLTPWKISEHLQFLRDRAARDAKAQALRQLIEREQARQARLRLGGDQTVAAALDLWNPSDALNDAGVPQHEVLWPSVSPEAVVDCASAARFWIDLFRAREDLRARFPLAFSSPDPELFQWLRSADVQRELRLSDEGVQHLVALLSNDFAARARQFLMTRDDIRAVLPHGLMPSGRRSLWRWFFQHGLPDSNLSLEEVWWLFLQAAEDPQGERVRAFLFTSAWQRQYPDALTVFGWRRFSAWIDQTYGADQGVEASRLPSDLVDPAVQIRIAYRSSSLWQAIHPHALSDPDAARALIRWLASSDEALIDREARAWCAALDSEAVVSGILNGGVNVIGHFCYPSGLRVSVEAMVAAMGLMNIPTSLRDVRTDARDDAAHIRFDGLESGDVTIIHAQPEPFFAEAYARADLAERDPRTYRIAYWYWEFDSIPESWKTYADTVDEVWTATEFIAQGLRERLSIPVRTLFPGVTLAPFQVRDRSYFKLDPGDFTFLFTFHMMSVMERKNPLGLIRAFRRAFRADEPVRLVLKTSFGDRHPKQFQELLDAVAAEPTITIIDEVFSSDDVLSLMNTCDAYVSLHRSEGLGLTMAEAMLMGKPVIATAFSGNMDFMNEDNSLLVPFQRVKVGRPIPPYNADLEWAQPSEEHAAKLMRRLFDDQQWAREIGARGKRSAEASLSLEAAGQRIAKRLAEIAILRTNSLRTSSQS